MNCFESPLTGSQGHNSLESTLDRNIILDSDDEDEILLSTQPVDQRVLKDVVAYVEVRSNAENRSKAVQHELELLGAAISKKFGPEVTHVVFKDGKKSTREKAIKKGVFLVSVLWVDSCKRSQEHVSELRYPISSSNDDGTPTVVAKLRKLKSMQPNDFDDEVANSLDKGEKKRRRNALVEKWKTTGGSPCLSRVLALETQPMSPLYVSPPLSPGLTIPDTPNSMKRALENLQKRKQLSDASPSCSVSETPGCDKGESQTHPQHLRILSDYRDGQESPTSSQRVTDSNKKLFDDSNSENCALSYNMERGTNDAGGESPLIKPAKKKRRLLSPINKPVTMIPEPTLSSHGLNAVCTDEKFEKGTDVANDNRSEERKKTFTSGTMLSEKSVKSGPDKRKSETPSAIDIKTALKKRKGCFLKIPSETLKGNTNTDASCVGHSGEYWNDSTDDSVDCSVEMRTSIKSVKTRYSMTSSAVAHRHSKDAEKSSSIIFADKVVRRKSRRLSLLPLQKDHKENIAGSKCLESPALLDNNSPKSAVLKRRKSCRLNASQLGDIPMHLDKCLEKAPLVAELTSPASFGSLADKRKSIDEFRSLKTSSTRSSKSSFGSMSCDGDQSDMDTSWCKSSDGEISCVKGKTRINSCGDDKKCRRSTSTLVLTSLHFSEQDVVMSIVKKLGGFTMSDTVTDTTTHVVCGSARRTVNVLHAVTHGCWVVSLQWVLESLEHGKWLPEEPFELSQDFPAAKICRQLRSTSGGHVLDLFSDMGPMYVSETSAPPRDALVALITKCGGTVTRCLRKCALCIGDVIRRENKDAVKELWVLDSIMSSQKLSIDDYVINPSRSSDGERSPSL